MSDYVNLRLVCMLKITVGRSGVIWLVCQSKYERRIHERILNISTVGWQVHSTTDEMPVLRRVVA